MSHHNSLCKWGAGFAEPGGFFCKEMGGEGIEDALMVVVEPLDFLLGHHLNEDGGLVDGTEGERLELVSDSNWRNLPNSVSL